MESVIKIKKFVKILSKIMFLMLITVILTIGGLYLYSYMSPKINIKTNGNFYIYDNESNLVYQGSSPSEWINIESISDNLKMRL